MTRPYSRRSFLETSLVAGAALAARPISRASVAQEARTHPPARPGFPVADYHVHLSPTLSIEQAIALGKERQVQIGIVEHPGPGFPINTDADLRQYVDRLRRYPVRVGLQPVYAGWSKSFSKSVLDELDYVLMDALTMPRPDRPPVQGALDARARRAHHQPVPGSRRRTSRRKDRDRDQRGGARP